MAIGHIAIRPHSRGRGHSAAAALAYRHAVALVDCRTGINYDFTHRDVRDAELVGDGLAAHPAWDHGTTHIEKLQALADRIEGAERRKNSRILRDIQPALPCELDEKQQLELTREFAERLAERYSTTVSWAVHRPKAPEPPDVLGPALDQAGYPRLDTANNGEEPDPAAAAHHDLRNTHAHIVLPTRQVSWTGQFGDKLRQLDDRRGPQEVVEIRALWERTANEALAGAGSDARVRTGLRVDAEPEPTAEPGATRAERKAAQKRAAQHRKDNGGQARRYAPALTEAVTLGLDALAEAERAIRRRIAATRRQLAAIYTLIATALRAPRLQPALAAAGASAGSAPTRTDAEPRAPPKRPRRDADQFEAGRERAAELFVDFLGSLPEELSDETHEHWFAWLDRQAKPEPPASGSVKATDEAGFDAQEQHFDQFLRSLPWRREAELREHLSFWRRQCGLDPEERLEPELAPGPR